MSQPRNKNFVFLSFDPLIFVIKHRPQPNSLLQDPLEERLNAYHRKQLKKILNIRYPPKITNKSLYRICQEKPLSLQVLSARWSFFGHILRRNKDILANKATRAYFIPIVTNCDQRVFNRGLTLIQHSIRLHSRKDLAEIKELAQDRKCWNGITSQIEKAAEVSQTRKWDTTWQYVSKSSHDPQTFVINISQLKLHPKIINMSTK